MAKRYGRPSLQYRYEHYDPAIRGFGHHESRVLPLVPT